MASPVPTDGWSLALMHAPHASMMKAFMNTKTFVKAIRYFPDVAAYEPACEVDVKRALHLGINRKAGGQRDRHGSNPLSAWVILLWAGIGDTIRCPCPMNRKKEIARFDMVSKSLGPTTTRAASTSSLARPARDKALNVTKPSVCLEEAQPQFTSRSAF